MAKGIRGSGHTEYWLRQTRKDSMGSKYVGNGHESSKPQHTGKKMTGKGGRRGC